MRLVKRLFFFTLLLVPGLALAQQTGKIAGTVTDAETDEPLPGVNVIIVGTTQGTTTDAEGYYNILNVRPGVYDLRASFLGYTAAVFEDVEVNIDLTTEVNFRLQEEAVGLDEVVVTAEQPIIQRDISGSEHNISQEELQAAPFQSLNSVIKAQVSVDATGLHNDRAGIRGSDFEQMKMVVDGVDVSDPLTSRPFSRVNLDAIQEVKLQTGGFSAEFGNLSSGVLNVVTKEGGDTYSGSVNFSYSAPGLKHFGPMLYSHESAVVTPFVDPTMAFQENDFFDGWISESASPTRDPQHAGSPQELYALWLWRHRSQDSIDMLEELASNGGHIEGAPGEVGDVDVEFAPGKDPDDLVYHEVGDMPDYNMSLTLGGPVPGLNALKFFLAYDRQQTEYIASFPEPAYNDQSFRGKLTTNVGRDTKVNVTGFWSQQRGGEAGQGPDITGWITSNPYRIFDNHNKFWYTHCAVPGQQTRQAYSTQITNTLSPSTFVQLDLSHHRTDYEMLNEIRNTAPVQGIEGQTALLQGLIGHSNQARWEELGVTPEDFDPTNYQHRYLPAVSDPNSPYYINGYENWQDWALMRIGDYWYDEGPVGYTPVWWVDVSGYYRMASCNVRYNETDSRKWEAKGSISSQVNRYNYVKAGFEVSRTQLSQYYYALDPSVNGGSLDESNSAPWYLGVYAQDKLEYRGFVANLGLRLEGMIHSGFPLLNGEGDEGPYTRYLLPGNTSRIDEETGEKEYIFTELVPNGRHADFRLSPRLGISHPISTVAKIFFNYGHMYQYPNLFSMYRIRYSTRQGGRVDRIGNPELDPVRTIMYEIGYEHNLFDRMNLRLTGYYKDINNETAEARYYPLGQSDYRTDINMGFRDIRGLEGFLQLRRDVIPFISGWASVNYLIESDGRFGYDYFYQDPTEQPREVSTEVSRPDVRPILRGNLDFYTPEEFGPSAGGFSLLGGLNVSLLYTWRRGHRFTWNPNELPEVLVDGNVRWRPYSRWDLRLTKNLFSQGRFDAMFYVDMTNLFNQRHLVPWNNNSDDYSVFSYFTWGNSGAAPKWWSDDVFRQYMESLDLTVNEDGSVSGDERPGDWDREGIALPPWSSFRFLDKRDIFFGIRLYF